MSPNRTRALISRRIFPLWMREKHASQQRAIGSQRKISALLISLAISFGGTAIPWQRAYAQAIAACGGAPTIAGIYACYNGPGATSAVGATTSLSTSVANVSTSLGNVSTSLGTVIQRYRPILYVENDRAVKSPALIRAIAALEYRLYWHHPPMFNPNNFAGNPENIFGETCSINMLCLPRESQFAMDEFEEILNYDAHPLM